jgi:hypothetical protein
MTAWIATATRNGELRTAATRLALAVATAGSLLVAGRMVADPSRGRFVMAAAAIALVAGIGVRAPKALLYGLVLWLGALGLVRRLASQFGPAPQSDPLLLVEATAIVILVAVAAVRGAFRDLTRLAKAVLVLSLLVVLGALNPLGGSLSANFGSLFLILVPMLAFWVGRGLCDDRTLVGVLTLVAVIAVAAGIYGLEQTFSGFPSWDAAWIRDTGYSALNVGSAIRAFGPFSSASEYAAFLAIGLAVWLVLGFRLARIPFTLAAVALLGTALFFESSRGVIFTTVFALALMAAAWRKLPLAVSVVLGVAALLAIPAVARSVGPTSSSTSIASALATHQIEGLASPFNSESSTLRTHLSMLEEGLRTAFREPIGLGIGAVTIAGSKYGGQTQGTEADPSNAAVALGIPGLIAYLAVVGGAFVKAYSLASRRRDALSLAALGVLVITLAQWLNGGQYAVAFLVWLVLGWTDRARSPQGG